MKTVYALVAALALVPSGPAHGQCTSETEQGRRVVMEFATLHGPGSRPAGVPVVPASEVRLLSNVGDAAVCQQLHHQWTGQRHDPDSPRTDLHATYYQVGSQYYVVVTRVSPPVEQTSEGIRLRLGWTPILVFNSGFEHITTVGR